MSPRKLVLFVSVVAAAGCSRPDPKTPSDFERGANATGESLVLAGAVSYQGVRTVGRVTRSFFEGGTELAGKSWESGKALTRETASKHAAVVSAEAAGKTPPSDGVKHIPAPPPRVVKPAAAKAPVAPAPASPPESLPTASRPASETPSLPEIDPKLLEQPEAPAEASEPDTTNDLPE